MPIAALEARLRGRLPLDAAPGTQVCEQAEQAGHQIELRYGIDRHGRHAMRYFCDGARLQRETLLMLLCPEGTCPHARAVQLRWQAFRGHAPDLGAARPAPPRARRLSGAPHPAALMVEVSIREAGHHCSARPAMLACQTACPVGAHPPCEMQQPGWDLFEDGVWLAGGRQVDGRTGLARPVFRTLTEARQWLARYREQGQAVLARFHGGGPRG